MARFAGNSSKKAGLPPGTLVHIGQKRSEEVTITALVYDRDHAEDHEIGDIGGCFPQPDRQNVTWIDVEGLHDVEAVERIGGRFGFHPLFLEDIVNTGTRSEIEDFGEYILIMETLHQDQGRDEITAGQISLVLGKNYVVTFQERKGDVFDHVRRHIHSPGSRVRKDVYDHTIQIMGTLDTYRDIIGGLLDVYPPSLSDRMNQIMKVLTIFATIFIPLTFLAGVYGMNFYYMPERNRYWACPAFRLASITIGLSLLAMFKKMEWM